MKPITPEGAQTAEKVIPNIVIEAVNELIVEHFNRSTQFAKINQNDIIDSIINKSNGKISTKQFILDNNFLDFEAHYENVGWKVTYDKPGYNESYKAFFVFEPKNKN